MSGSGFYGYNPGDYRTDFSFLGDIGASIGKVAFAVPQIIEFNRTLKENADTMIEVFDTIKKTGRDMAITDPDTATKMMKNMGLIDDSGAVTEIGFKYLGDFAGEPPVPGSAKYASPSDLSIMIGNLLEERVPSPNLGKEKGLFKFRGADDAASWTKTALEGLGSIIAEAKGDDTSPTSSTDELEILQWFRGVPGAVTNEQYTTTKYGSEFERFMSENKGKNFSEVNTALPSMKIPTQYLASNRAFDAFMSEAKSISKDALVDVISKEFVDGMAKAFVPTMVGDKAGQDAKVESKERLSWQFPRSRIMEEGIKLGLTDAEIVPILEAYSKDFEGIATNFKSVEDISEMATKLSSKAREATNAEIFDINNKNLANLLAVIKEFPNATDDMRAVFTEISKKNEKGLTDSSIDKLSQSWARAMASASRIDPTMGAKVEALQNAFTTYAEWAKVVIRWQRGYAEALGVPTTAIEQDVANRVFTGQNFENLLEYAAEVSSFGGANVQKDGQGRVTATGAAGGVVGGDPTEAQTTATVRGELVSKATTFAASVADLSEAEAIVRIRKEYPELTVEEARSAYRTATQASADTAKKRDNASLWVDAGVPLIMRYREANGLKLPTFEQFVTLLPAAQQRQWLEFPPALQKQLYSQMTDRVLVPSSNGL